MVETYNKIAAISPVPPPPAASAFSQSSSSRRRFVLGMLGAAVVAASVSAPVVWLKVKNAFVPVQPGAADLELAALGVWFQQSSPEHAQHLEMSARQVAGLAATARIDWETAFAARPVLTEHSRVQAEVGRGDTVYANGWLLSHSEIGLALLFAAANANATHETIANSPSPAPLTE